jgi:hypothetical protein
VKPLGNGSLEAVAFAVCTKLKSHGIKAILTGGGAASFYAPQAYRTRDLDFLLNFSSAKSAHRAMLELGFTHAHSRNIYESIYTPLTIDLLEDEPRLGENLSMEWQTIEKNGQVLNIITPTDCIRDRLSSALYWNDVSSLSQAAYVAVEIHDQIDFKTVEDWCLAEGGEIKYRQFLALLNHRLSGG